MSLRTIRKFETFGARFPKSEGTARPFRLWDELLWDDKLKRRGKAIPHRYYKNELMAHANAFMELKYCPIGTVLAVYNAETGMLVTQYKRHAGGVEFREAGKP